jgi:dipeptidyl aminopeptidase/acylaminoacyl peptidase
MSTIRSSFAAACLTVVLGAPAAAQAARIELDDLGREVTLAGPRLSPDGRQVAVVVSRTNYPDNRFERSLVLVDVATGSWRELTPGRRNVGGAEWSPSGDRLAFLDREPDKQSQLYVLPIGGGEARRITETKRGVIGFAWRPDGQAFAFLTEDEPTERTGAEKHNKSFEVGDNTYLDQSASLSTHLWTVAAAGGEATRVTSGVRSVKSVTWTPDGKRWLMSVWPRPHSGEGINATVVVREVASGAERTLSDRRGFGSSVVVSPDGRLAAHVASRGPELGFHPGTAIVTPLDGGSSREVTAGLDRDVGGLRWLPDSRGLVVAGPDLTRQRVWVQPLDGRARLLEWGSINAGEVHLNGAGAAVFVGREANWPGELYHVGNLDGTPRRLTEFNRELAGKALGRVETVSWQGPDGFSQNGVVVYPPGYTTGRQYPLVLNIHGGPMGTSTESWSTSNQLLAAQGWIVFNPNYRGSNNMGDKFQSAVVNDAGDGPGRDVMSGVAALKAKGVIDPSRIAVTGWSYGGYMTAWLTAKYPDFRAAVAGAAVTDWFDWYNLADMNTWAGFGLGGSPWKNDNAMNYWRQSPMAYAHQIKTPTLILSTSGDPRVTVTQSYKLYHALKDNGTPVQFIVYPTGGHFPPDPVHQRDVWRRWVDWIAKQFGPTS